MSPTTDEERQQVVVYIAEMARGLADMSALHRLDTLAYLLEMVELEAQSKMPKVTELKVVKCSC